MCWISKISNFFDTSTKPVDSEFDAILNIGEARKDIAESVMGFKITKTKFKKNTNSPSFNKDQGKAQLQY